MRHVTLAHLDLSALGHGHPDGIAHVCFEASDDIGGDWYFANSNGRASSNGAWRR